jgi:cation-transporting ATPase E
MVLALTVKKKKRETQVRPKIKVFIADPEAGLSSPQVSERISAGWVNRSVEPPTKSTGQIIASNLLTYFNLVFFFLAACVIAVGSWRNLMFMPVVLANIFIGIVQELRSKKTLDKLALLTSPKGVVIRDGERRTINTEEMVRDDIVVFAAGNQVFADAVVVSGTCHVNEALITGEAEEIKKSPGDKLLSGSFVISGSCRARLTRVGADSYAAKLTLEAKKSKKRIQSEMMRSLSQLVKWIGLILIPFGVALCIKEISWLGRSVEDGVVSTVGALVGMIPEGLYLLTSLALAAGVIRLAQRKTLVHELGCIETLARVDTLCVDKTGTITENKMIVEDLALLCEDRFNEADIRMIMSDYVYAMQDDNDTAAALKNYFSGEVRQKAIKALPFSSARKYGGVSFHEDETYILGAPEIILGVEYPKYSEKIDYYSSRGCRVLLLALYDGDLEDQELSAEIMPLALILLANKIRPEAPETFKFFAKQGVEIKVISGDNPMTVSEVARRAGIKNAEKYVDARTLDSDKKLAAAATEYTVFGRVTPDQKRKLIKALKAAGRTVAMTGDGVNDVLALKEADCSIAMASGSDVACRVSHIVLLNSDFSSMPSVVMEGRRVINNIERAAALYLVKNIFSFLLALVSLFFTLPYPVTPAQLSLVSSLTIGIPSFFLAMEPNEGIVKGKFLPNVIYRALPGGLTDLVLVLGILLFYIAFNVNAGEMSTICAIVMGIVGLLVVHRTCKPYTPLRKILMWFLSITFGLCVLFLKGLFTLSPLDFPSMLVLAVFSLLAYPIMSVFSKWLDDIKNYFQARHSKHRRHRRNVKRRA